VANNVPSNNQMQLTSGGLGLEEARTVPRIAAHESSPSRRSQLI